MRNLKFKYVKAENFLCFGPEGVEINFENYGKIVCIKGKNLDVNDEKSSNGSGKSSCIDVPVYALYGKTVKKPKKLGHTDVINNQSDKPLRVEFRWDDYRVVRTRKGNSGTLSLWKSAEGKWDKSTEISLGGMPATQKYIEEIIGLSYDTFVNLYVFSDDPTTAFLECDGPTKREIVENLLSLEKYRGYHDNAKTFVKNCKDKIKLLTKDYDHLTDDLKLCEDRIKNIDKQEKDWLATKELELNKILAAIKSKRNEIDKTDAGSALADYREAQERIASCREKIPELETKRNKCTEALKEGEPKCKKTQEEYERFSQELNDVVRKKRECEDIIAKNEKIIENIKNKAGTECPSCFGTVDSRNFTKILSQAEEVISSKKEQLESLAVRCESVSLEVENAKKVKDKLELLVSKARSCCDSVNKELSGIHADISQLAKIKEPQVGISDILAQEQLDELKKQAEGKKIELGGPSPFVEIKKSSEKEYALKGKEVETKKKEVKKSEEEVPYYEYWVKAFGDSGIRKYVIDGIIPALNSKINYWLQFLIDNKIKLEFDNELKEKIDRYPFKGRPYIYHGMSGGQRRRLNLTVSQAFAHIMMLNCGASPSVVFLDEVTQNIDILGIYGIYRMICELSKEKQVFVIDHNSDLLEMLNGCDIINLEMSQEISKIVRR